MAPLSLLPLLLTLARTARTLTQDLGPLRSLTDCLDGPEPTLCLQWRAAAALDRAARTDLPVGTTGAVLVRTREAGGRALTQEDLQEAANSGSTADLLWDRAARFLSSHTLRMDLPQVDGQQLKQGFEQGRGKMKKMMGMMMMGGAMKAMMVIPLALGALFLLAGKALIIAKVALVLALIITLKKLLNSKQEEHHGWSSGGHGGGGGWDRRAINSHELVYSGYKPHNGL